MNQTRLLSLLVIPLLACHSSEGLGRGDLDLVVSDLAGPALPSCSTWVSGPKGCTHPGEQCLDCSADPCGYCTLTTCGPDGVYNSNAYTNPACTRDLSVPLPVVECSPRCASNQACINDGCHNLITTCAQPNTCDCLAQPGNIDLCESCLQGTEGVICSNGPVAP